MNKNDAKEILRNLSVEKYGAEKKMTFLKFLKEISNRHWYFLICSIDNYKFLIVSERIFTEENIKANETGKIKLLDTVTSIDEAIIFHEQEEVRIFWFDYGYFVFG